MHGPTVQPAADFDAFRDAKLLHDVIFSVVSGKEEAVASVLCCRSSEQREEIAQWYTETSKRDLAADITSAFNGEFKELMVALCMPFDDFYARELHRAIKDHRGNVIAEIFGSLFCSQLWAVKQAYHRVFHTSLKEDMLSHNGVRKLAILELLAMVHREESTDVDEQKLRRDLVLLQNLKQEAERVSHKHETFRQMLAIDGYTQLRALFDAYEQSVGSSVDELIRKAFAEDEDGEALISLSRAIDHRLTAFAKNLRSYYGKETKWCGVSNSQHDVMRIVVGRSEIDLAHVLQKYKSMYGSTFLAESNDAFDDNYATALAVLTGRV